jgi:hypothetical protein
MDIVIYCAEEDRMPMAYGVHMEVEGVRWSAHEILVDKQSG